MLNRTKLRLLTGLAGTALMLGLTVLPASAAGVTILANDGSYFTPSGPWYYWHYDHGQGYCGQFASWCRPSHFRWTYKTDRPFYYENKAVWTVPTPQYYPGKAFAFVPRRNATANPAFYTVHYGYTSTQLHTLTQKYYYDQWVPINSYGLFRIRAVELDDGNYGYVDPYGKVAFDEIKIET